MAIVLVTGATAGFGQACATTFAAKGYDVIITGRRKERLEEVSTQLTQEFGVNVLALHFDVRNQDEVNTVLGGIPEEWRRIDVLVNNAGLAAGLDPIDQGNTEDWDAMIDTNIKGLLYVSHVVMPWMRSRTSGHIINIGSTAAKIVYAKGNVYCATKAAVDAITQGMRIDLLPYRIKVTAVHPGAAETEFSMVRFKGNEDKAKAVYEGLIALSAQDVADVVYYCTTLPPHVCINDLVMTPIQQANAYYTDRK
ncbi:NADP-dependent 3-hydroxy acid dehydrogenase YdfG [Chitinophaga terrae (ex Kim and Jung 2007)]|uniref:NADP-dependent 3-hydroxy acid dehydrogenase YdfG n=1 Tax=Chitinophaga terrae (ex Kim and Jung 2007) TaxID=408074 RepID=A0A1H4DCS9_9BACT|nr:SDR family NAD(P)-dependent oxidoreductase [Chitinophaga terrae (ex Kim and Jung 2007)]MDQ0107767.1 NADP-dependent 3-hydroxy acid dehydrogenase YdfG [Chitinophaga terrae (ex Kim and Jung 2007)]GEP92586.1 short-chain dehydrogenase [Chitinophaga terrae (ex Kim and Jung 2007)]SEA70250.1 NADP-dependent 3-hydroxy acid dehydrogenase YdfG [Chitinophaga terrae (ex Kim and Jung 2007)]